MKTILVDGGSVGAKAKFSLGSLQMNMIPTGVIYGFLKEIQHLYEQFGSNDIIFFWDSKESLRRKIFPEYKIKRVRKKQSKREKDEWSITYEQYDRLRLEILPAIGFRNHFQVEGLEADDLLHKCAMDINEPDEVIMVTTDEDMYQSLMYCSMYKGKKVLFTFDDFVNQFGIDPGFWSEVKAIAGCTSDEVPGVIGVGAKTAIKFIKQELGRKYKTYEAIVAPSGQAIIERNRKLVTLPFPGTPECDLVWNKFDIEYFVEFCEELGMTSLLGQYSLPVWERMLK